LELVRRSDWKERVRRFFDREFVGEAPLPVQCVYWLEVARRRDLIDRFVPHAAEAIGIDLGCGTGEYMPQLCRRGYYAVGLDFSPESLRRAKLQLQRFRFCADFVLCDLEAIPLRNEIGDCLFLVEVIQSLQDKKKLFIEMARISKRVGRLLLFMPNQGSIRLELAAAVRRIKIGAGVFFSSNVSVPASPVTQRELTSLAGGVGFLVTHEESFWFPPSWLLEALRYPPLIHSAERTIRKFERARVLAESLGTQTFMVFQRQARTRTLNSRSSISLSGYPHSTSRAE
jgi:SAM-dependent methyltransferase